MNRMQKRIIFGAIMIVVVAAVLWADWRLEQCVRDEAAREQDPFPLILGLPFLLWVGIPTAMLVSVIVVLGFLEFRKLADGAGVGILPVSGLLACLAMIAGVQKFQPDLGVEALFPARGGGLMAFLLALIFAEQMLRYRTDGALARIGVTGLAVLYLGVCGAVALQIRLEHGVTALVLFLAAAKFTDIGAYFTGSFIGKHKLIPWLSPGKSWEGLLGGVVAGSAACMAASWAFRRVAVPTDVALSTGQAAIFGAVVGLAGQFADLCESLLKRSANLKDSGAVVPEFGGVLDIIDSVLLSAPVAAILLAVMTG